MMIYRGTMFTPTEGSTLFISHQERMESKRITPLPSINPSMTTCGQPRRAGANGRGTERLASLELTSFVLVCE